MRAIRFQRTGGPEVLELAEVPEPSLPDDGLLVDVRAAGVNFIDNYFRNGVYPMDLPGIPGDEGVGVVRAVGAATMGFAPGDRVAWTGGHAGYAEVAVAPAKWTIRLPGSLPDEAGFVIAQGLTAHYLAVDVAGPRSGDTALVHSAAGGVGALLVQILKLRGARVIATVSSEAKVAVARDAGADAVLVIDGDDFSSRVRDLTGGRGVLAVYDGIGRDSFEHSLASVALRGTMVLYGAASGPVPPVDPQALARAGSVSLVRPRLYDFLATRQEFELRMADLFRWMAEGRLRVAIGGRYPLARAADAQRALESRATTGKLILTVGAEASA